MYVYPYCNISPEEQDGDSAADAVGGLLARSGYEPPFLRDPPDQVTSPSREEDIRLPGKGNSPPHGARRVY